MSLPCLKALAVRNDLFVDALEHKLLEIFK